MNNFYDIVIKLDDLMTSSNKLDEIELYFKFRGIKKYFFYSILGIKDYISWLIPLQHAGFFNIDNHPQNEDYAPYIPYWDVLEYLKKVSEENEKNENPIITTTIIEIINPIIEKSNILKNFRTDYYIGQIISTLPIDKFSNEYINFFQDAIIRGADLITDVINNKLISKLLLNKSKKMLLDLLKVILNFKIENRRLIINETSESFSVLSDYWLSEIIKKNKNEIIQLCGIEIINLIIKIMDDLITLSQDSFNIIWITTIEDNPQTSFRDKYECQIVYLLRDAIESFNSREITETISSLFKKDHPIFKRIAIYIVNKKYNELNDIFWFQQWNPIQENSLKHELYELLKTHCNEFSEIQIDQVITWIETTIFYEKREDITEEQIQIYTAYNKKEFYNALKTSNNKKVLSKYKENNAINPDELDHPGFSYWSEGGGFVGKTSPLSSEEINKMEIDKLVKYLLEFKGEIGWEKPSDEGLGNALSKAVEEMPNRYSENINNFIQLLPLYQYNLVSGLRNVIEKDIKSLQNLENLISYFNNLADKDEFKSYTNDPKSYHYEAQILISISRLIEFVLNEKELVLSDEIFEKIENLLFRLLNITQSTATYSLYKDKSDLITYVLNSPLGTVYDAIIAYSLRYARQYISKENIKKWKKSIEDLFNHILSSDLEQSIEFYTVLGEYFSHLYYLNMEWVKENINKIFPKENKEFWEAAMTGYFRSSKVYKNNYNLLKETNNLSTAISFNFKSGYTYEQLLRQIIVGYFQDWEDIKDENSLISNLLIKCEIKYFNTITNFIWASRKFFTDDEKKNKVKIIWEKIVSRFKKINYDILNEDEKKDFHNTVKSFLDILSIFDIIDDIILNCIIFTITNINKNIGIHNLIEDLNRLVDANPTKVGEIFIALLESSNYPTYPESSIENIIQKLYNLGEKDKAGLICNKYGEEGIYFLKSVYLKNLNNE